MYSATAALALVVLLAIVDTGLCLNCYQCTSMNDLNCKDPTNNRKDVLPSIDCNTPAVAKFYNTYLSFLSSYLPAPHTANAPKYCLKLVFDGTTGETVVRTCVEGAADNINKTCVDLEQSTQKTLSQVAMAVTKTSLKHCSVCNEDGCNGAVGTSASVTLAVGAAALAYYGLTIIKMYLVLG